MQKLTLETSYEKNGNSSGSAIDTLAIALGQGDYNSCEEYNFDYIHDQEQK